MHLTKFMIYEAKLTELKKATGKSIIIVEDFSIHLSIIDKTSK